MFLLQQVAPLLPQPTLHSSTLLELEVVLGYQTHPPLADQRRLLQALKLALHLLRFQRRARKLRFLAAPQRQEAQCF